MPNSDCIRDLRALAILALAALTCGASATAKDQSQPATPQNSTINQHDSDSKDRSVNAANTQTTVDPGQYRPGIGTIIVAELANSIGVKNAKVGDKIECKVTQDLLYQGKIVVPRSARVIGRVTEVETSSKEHHESRLGVSFDRVLLKDKKELLFENPAIVVALAPPIKRIVTTNNKVGDLPVAMEKGGQGGAGGSSGGSTTGGSVLDAITANPNLVGANVASSSGAISAANRGVVGWPGLVLLKGAPGTSIIASPKGNVELWYESQLVLRVAEITSK